MRQAHALAPNELHAGSLILERGAERLKRAYPFDAGIGADYVPPLLVVQDVIDRDPGDSREPIARPSE